MTKFPMLRRLKRPGRLVILLGGRLVGTDTIVPLAMALAEEDPALEIEFLFVNRGDRATVERNYVLMAAMRQTGRIGYLSPGGGGLGSKLAGAIRLLAWMGRLVGRRSWLLCYSAPARLPVWPLALAARLAGGAVLIYAKTTYPPSAGLRRAHTEEVRGQPPAPPLRGRAERFLIYHPDQADYYRAQVAAPPIVLGTPRHYRTWRAHLDTIGGTVGLTDESGARIGMSGAPKLAVFYPGHVAAPEQTNNPGDSFLAFLRIAAEEIPDASIVVKPHPICDLARLRRDISDCGLDIHICHAHPQFLARRVEAALFTNGSLAMNDIYGEGTPILDTSQYVPSIKAEGGGLFPNRGRLDASTEAKLRVALRTMRDQPGALPEPDRTGLVWPRVAGLLEHIAAGTGQPAPATGQGREQAVPRQ